jgi:hypothetical protein
MACFTDVIFSSRQAIANIFVGFTDDSLEHLTSQNIYWYRKYNLYILRICMIFVGIIVTTKHNNLKKIWEVQSSDWKIESNRIGCRTLLKIRDRMKKCCINNIIIHLNSMIIQVHIFRNCHHQWGDDGRWFRSLIKEDGPLVSDPNTGNTNKNDVSRQTYTGTKYWQIVFINTGFI